MLGATLLAASLVVVGQTADVKVTVPAEVLQEFEYLVGDWQGEGTNGSETAKVQYNFTWAKNKVSLDYSYSGKGQQNSWLLSGIVGWDAVKKQIMILEFGTDGEHSLLRCKVTMPKDRWEGVFEGTNTLSNEMLNGKFVLTRNEPKQVTFATTDVRNANGDPRSGWTTRLQRLQKQ
jgi:hypothetical protein